MVDKSISPTRNTLYMIKTFCISIINDILSRVYGLNIAWEYLIYRNVKSAFDRYISENVLRNSSIKRILLSTVVRNGMKEHY